MQRHPKGTSTKVSKSAELKSKLGVMFFNFVCAGSPQANSTSKQIDRFRNVFEFF
jgi:hypothetical protein